jgi:hypothetical protein
VTTVQFDQMMTELRAICAAVERLDPKVDPNQVRREFPDGRLVSYPRLPVPPQPPDDEGCGIGADDDPYRWFRNKWTSVLRRPAAE